MAVREVLKMGDPRLLEPAQPVTDFTSPELAQLLLDMHDTMTALSGAGLAAPVSTSLEGKSAFDETHPLALGSGGAAIPKTVRHFLDSADVNRRVRAVLAWLRAS